MIGRPLSVVLVVVCYFPRSPRRVYCFCATGQHSLLVLHSFTNLVSLQPVVFRHWQEATAYKYDIYLLPTTGRKLYFSLFTSRATCAGEPKLAPQAVCVWIREEHVRSVENRGAQHVVQLCTRQLGCMQNSTVHITLTNMSLPSASSLESP